MKREPLQFPFFVTGDREGDLMSIINDVSDYIRQGETTGEDLGLEIEHFVINSEGMPMDFHVVSNLIAEVAGRIGARIIYMDDYPVGYQTEEYAVTLEPSCQFEISISPYSDIDRMKEVYDGFIKLWEPIFSGLGYHFDRKGNLPLVEKGLIAPDDIPLSPKKRYKYMDAYFRNSGRYGKYMMRASASTQVSVDYRSEEDLIRKLRLLEQLSPIFMAVMESKTDEASVLQGHEDEPHLLRIQEWDDLDHSRTGFFPGAFDPDFGYDKAAEVICNIPLILLTDEDVTTDVSSKTALDLTDDCTIDPEGIDDSRKRKIIEHIISMGFFHFRIKRYIEIRVADSVSIERALGYVALIKGIIYSDENIDILADELSDIDSADKIQSAVDAIKKDGIDAVIYGGRTVLQWAEHLIELAGDKLENKDKEYLKNVRALWSNI